MTEPHASTPLPNPDDAPVSRRLPFFVLAVLAAAAVFGGAVYAQKRPAEAGAASASSDRTASDAAADIPNPRGASDSAVTAQRAPQESPGPAAAQTGAPAETPKVEKPVEEPVEHPFPKRTAVPENILEGGKGWLNASGDIRLRDLKGKVVILDFWTYCCINCMHVLPDLAYLEKKYANELVVIGVHSAKFDNEKDSDNIRRAVQRYNIEHPVVNDADMTIWRKFGVNAWPTLVVLDAEGNYCGHASGEGKRELLDFVVGNLVKYHEATKTLDRTPVRFDLERAKLPDTPLRFPGKVLADEARGRLFIADTNHNRIVIASLDGKLLDVIGSGAIGAADGGYAEASFDHPQGMAVVDSTLYVADTENHLLRTVDLRAKQVATLAGTGQQDRERTQGGPLRETALNSPWDVLVLDGDLYIAMAGPHQIWRHRIGSAEIAAFAGSGREDVKNGSLEECAFAQPSGLASDGKVLFIADSEGSAIRRLSLGKDGEATTIAGTHDLFRGQSLFAFGDVDGRGDEARFQHPIGVAWHDGAVYVADSYNHKIKKVTLKGAVGDAITLLGDVKPGTTVDPPRFNEPHGLSIAGGRLYIADTNNHRIVSADLASGKATELAIAGLAPPKPQKSSGDDPVGAKAPVELAEQKVAPGDALRLEIAIDLPEGYKLNPQTPVTVRLVADGDQALLSAEALGRRHECVVEDGVAAASLPIAAKSGGGVYQVALSFTYCRDGRGGVCKLGSGKWKVPVTLGAGGAKSIRLTSKVE